jgi:UDP-N-acetylmuramoyl-L-alanyl-D-glutamate--2,6-diaminopimelate ligase
MTWAELHGVLRGRGLIRADDALRAEAAVGAVTGIAYDSRAIEPGQVFVALRGQHADGTAFARQAIERGAAAVVAEQPAPDGVQVPWAIVEDARLAMAVLAAAFYRDPSREMRVIGITGTNGKTTTAHLVASIFDAADIRCGILGTVGYRIGDELREATRTTPEAPDVQALLREMVERQCGACAMEVSSHALSLRRVDGITFAAAIFTNLTRDHLDFHADMDDYFRAKRRLFEMLPRDAPSLVNLDDPRGASLREAGGRPTTYAINRPADVTPGRWCFRSAACLRRALRAQRAATTRSWSAGPTSTTSSPRSRPRSFARRCSTRSRAACSRSRACRRFQVVSGRQDKSPRGRLRAHTDDALQSARDGAAARAGRLITVCSAAAAIDRTKLAADGRGRRAAQRSDRDHLGQTAPRGSEPIIEEVLRGITPTRGVTATLLTSSTGAPRSPRRSSWPDRRRGCWWRAKGHEKHLGDRRSHGLPFD